MKSTESLKKNKMPLRNLKKNPLQKKKKNQKKTTREKGRDLTQSYDKSPYTKRKAKKQSDVQQKRHQNFNYLERLRTDSS